MTGYKCWQVTVVVLAWVITAAIASLAVCLLALPGLGNEARIVGLISTFGICCALIIAVACTYECCRNSLL
jgi:hypothetical protein